MWAAESRSSRIVCSQYRRCQMPRSPRLVITSDRGSPTGNDFTNAVLIARHRPGKLASSSGNVHRQCMWSGRTTQASIWNGARARACRTASRRASIRATSKFDRRSSRFTVKKKVPPGTRLRHDRSMSGLAERRNALPLFRPTLAQGGLQGGEVSPAKASFTG